MSSNELIARVLFNRKPKLGPRARHLYLTFDGQINMMAFDNYEDTHNGPKCSICRTEVCQYCQPNWETLPCPGASIPDYTGDLKFLPLIITALDNRGVTLYHYGSANSFHRSFIADVIHYCLENDHA